MNYIENYKCSECGETGVKLWRDYNTMASAVELKCATCATPAQIKTDARYQDAGMRALDEDGVFTFAQGDQLGGLVPAVPTEDGDTFWGYSSAPSDRARWWHALPTYNDAQLEVRCLHNILGRTIAQRDDATGRWLAADRKVADLTWRIERKVYEVNRDGVSVTIYGWVTESMPDGGTFRYSKEMPRDLKVGDRIAVYRDRAVLMTSETLGECPSIMDHGQDGKALVRELLRTKSVFLVGREAVLIGEDASKASR